MNLEAIFFALLIFTLIVLGVGLMIFDESTDNKAAGFFMVILGVLGYVVLGGSKCNESQIQVKVIRFYNVRLSPKVNKLGTLPGDYYFTAFDGKDTLKVATTEAKTIRLKDTIVVTRKVWSTQFSKEVDSVRYSY